MTAKARMMAQYGAESRDRQGEGNSNDGYKLSQSG